jgi:hypothetical protein
MCFNFDFESFVEDTSWSLKEIMNFNPVSHSRARSGTFYFPKYSCPIVYFHIVAELYRQSHEVSREIINKVGSAAFRPVRAMEDSDQGGSAG